MPRNESTFSFNQAFRPYDRFLSAPALAKAKKLRKEPDGEQLPVKTTIRAGKIVPLYPWDKLLLGDFFMAPIGGKSAESMRIGFVKVASKRDFEVSVIKMSIAPGSDPTDKRDYLRVTVSAIGVNKAKELAFKEGYIALRPKHMSSSDEKRELALEKRAAARRKIRASAANVNVVPEKVDIPQPKLKSQLDAEAAVEAHERGMVEKGYRPGMTIEEKRAFALRKR